MYHSARDNPQTARRSADRGWRYGVRLRKENIDPEIHCMGTLLSAPPQSWREKPVIRSRRDGAEHPPRSLNVEIGGSRHPAQRFNSANELKRDLSPTRLALQPMITHSDTQASRDPPEKNRNEKSLPCKEEQRCHRTNVKRGHKK